MAEIILTRGEDGKLHGLGEADDRRWSKFLAKVRSMLPGDTVKAEFKLPRSPGFHRRHFAILQRLFENQEQFTDLDQFRQWIQVGAGFCDILPGPKGKPVAIPRSIAWDKLDDADFAEHHADVINFIRSKYFAQYLWPDMATENQIAAVETVLAEFDS